MPAKTRYKTRQRELVASCLASNAGRYLTIDEVLAFITAEGERIGRTTVYRALETMAQDGSALKASIPGGEASYRFAEESVAGQLVCLHCGNASPLDCHMARDLAEHVYEHHGFQMDPARTVLYGLCQRCMEDAHE